MTPLEVGTVLALAGLGGVVVAQFDEDWWGVALSLPLFIAAAVLLVVWG